jgi:hypothetical protein
MAVGKMPYKRQGKISKVSTRVPTWEARINRNCKIVSKIKLRIYRI